MKAVFFENLPYESDFRVGSHHYADAFLADGWDVFWVSHPLSPLHYVHPDKKDFAIRHEAWRRGPIEYGRLRYYSPFTLLPAADRPVLRSPLFAENTAGATLPSLRGVLERAGFGEPDVVWLTNPVFLPVARQLRARALAVRVADDNSAFRDVPPAMAAMERRALDEADIVFVVAGELYERMSKLRDGVVRLPNAVDFEHFAKPAPEPADLAAFARCMGSSTRLFRGAKVLPAGASSTLRRRRNCAICSPNTAAAVYRANADQYEGWRGSCAGIRPKPSAHCGRPLSMTGALPAAGSSVRCRSVRTLLISFRFRSNVSLILCREKKALRQCARVPDGALILSSANIAFAR